MAEQQIDLAKVIVSMEAQSAKYLKDLEKQRAETQKWRKKVSSNVGSVAKTFRNLAAAAGIAMLTRRIIDATAKQEQAVKQLEATWKSTAGAVGYNIDQLIGKAQDLQKTSTFSDEDLIKMQSQLMTFTAITGKNFDRTSQAVLDLSVKMDQDLRSSVLQLGKALNDPVGQLGALSRTGILFTDQQKEMIKTLAKSGDLMGAQDVILKELEREFGGSAQAARETFGGALEGLSNAFGDLLEGSGGKGGLTESRVQIEGLTALLQDPATRTAADGFTSALISGLATVLDYATKVANGIRSIAKEMAHYFNDNTLAAQRTKIMEQQRALLKELDTTPGGMEGKQGRSIIDRLRGLNAQLKDVEDNMKFLGQLDQNGNPISPSKPKAPAQGPNTPAAPTIAPPSVPPLSDKQLQSQFAGVQNSLMTEEESWRASYQKRMDIINEFAKRWPEKEAEAADARNKLIEEKNKHTLKMQQDVANARIEVMNKVLDVGIAIARDGSKAERALLAVQKAIALREAIIHLHSAMLKAMDSNLPFPANLAAIGTVASAGLDIISVLKGASTDVPSFLGGGFTGTGARSGGLDGKGGFTAMLHPNEIVLDPQSHGVMGGLVFNQVNNIDARDAAPGTGINIERALRKNRELTIEQVRKLMSQGRLGNK